MCKRQLIKLTAALMMISAFTSAAVSQKFSSKNSPKDARAYLINEVRKELVTLPYYGVFDWLEFEVSPDNRVILRGAVVRPSTKSDAESRLRDINNVSEVVNNIEVLPLSPSDDRLRIALYRAIYSWNSPLFRYGTQSIPPIHIIVKNGRATLKGFVANKADSNLANIKARGVPGLFDVKNELQIESDVP